MFEFDPQRVGKLAELAADGVAPYPTGGAPTHSSAQLRTLAAPLLEAAGDDKDRANAALAELGTLALAGRLMFKNDMGKAGFARILDRAGPIQVYCKKDHLGERPFALFKKLDLGDVIGVTGQLMVTRTGELTLLCRELRLLSKCITSLPDKFHGATDPEFRQRQRYVDLFVNEDTRRTFELRSRTVAYLRRYFEARGFLEVETPMMHAIPGGATARPFVTHHNALGVDLYLRVAPELYLKRLIVGGLERVFELNRNFRNEGIDLSHNPEFTMLEFYQAYATWRDLVSLTEDLLGSLCRDVLGTESLTYQGEAISFAPPFRVATYAELIAAATGLDPASIRDPAALSRWWQGHHAGETDPADAPTTMGRWWERIFDAHVEPTLRQPTFVVGFPTEISPLARRSDEDPEIADRFELFVAGREIANGFNELNDPVDQAARFSAQAKALAAGNDEAMHFDHDYVRALSYGMPPTAGEGIGIDRLLMLLCDAASIRDVILFPTLRPRS